MAKSKSEKRYIVTYENVDTTQHEAAEILSISDGRYTRCSVCHGN